MALRNGRLGMAHRSPLKELLRWPASERLYRLCIQGCAMAREPCDGCGQQVPIAGGIANLWSFEGDRTGGLSLTFADGSEHFLCFECVDALPDDPVAGDVSTLSVDRE